METPIKQVCSAIHNTLIHAFQICVKRSFKRLLLHLDAQPLYDLSFVFSCGPKGGGRADHDEAEALGVLLDVAEQWVVVSALPGVQRAREWFLEETLDALRGGTLEAERSNTKGAQSGGEARRSGPGPS